MLIKADFPLQSWGFVTSKKRLDEEEKGAIVTKILGYWIFRACPVKSSFPFITLGLDIEYSDYLYIVYRPTKK